jgi:hypothetical protein
MMRRIVGAVMVMAAVSACGDSVGPIATAGLMLGIESGNRQAAVVGSKQFVDAVRVRMVRADGATKNSVPGVTVVQGSPVVGAETCAMNVSATGQIVPWVPCRTTDSTGHAEYIFEAGTVAGEAVAEIRGIVNGKPVVFDTVRMTILPGEPAIVSQWAGNLGTIKVGDTLTIAALVKTVSDQYGNKLTKWTATWAFFAEQTTVTSPLPSLPNTEAVAVVPKGATLLMAKIGSAVVTWKFTAK